ncbi:MAG: hypothetical protein M9894_18340 [Planctomycetes bacterium]|nr:hypothetical protein [Planctomycetota bacterium]
MDERLRELERASAQGNLQAAAQRLAERVRRGDLGSERLALAAYCHDPAALLATGGPPPPTDAPTWAAGLGARHGLPLLLRVIAEALLDQVDEGHSDLPPELVRGLAAAVEAWERDPTPDAITPVRIATLALFRARGCMDVVHCFMYLTSAWSVDRRLTEEELLAPVAPALRALGRGGVAALRPERVAARALASGGATARPLAPG